MVIQKGAGPLTSGRTGSGLVCYNLLFGVKLEGIRIQTLGLELCNHGLCTADEESDAAWQICHTATW